MNIAALLQSIKTTLSSAICCKRITGT